MLNVVVCFIRSVDNWIKITSVLTCSQIQLVSYISFYWFGFVFANRQWRDFFSVSPFWAGQRSLTGGPERDSQPPLDAVDQQQVARPPGDHGGKDACGPDRAQWETESTNRAQWEPEKINRAQWESEETQEETRSTKVWSSSTILQLKQRRVFKAIDSPHFLYFVWSNPHIDPI